MSTYYPIFLNLQGKRCLVVGGGEVATRKVQGLLEAGALVAVVSPTLTTALSALVHDGTIRHEARDFRDDDVSGCALVIGATDQPVVNHAVYEASQRHRAWVNIVDVPAACDFIAPAVVRRGALQIAISTSGHSPTLAKRIRQQLEEQYGPEYAELLDWLGEERARIRRQVRDPAARTADYARLVNMVWPDSVSVSASP
jgi:precorrin-2 dehydrogenase/sirohydrochlorin ferrochelatase